jgi:predicted CoA-substrate-specific enzyme activase
LTQHYAGIDAGSRAIKAVVADGGGRPVGHALVDQGVRQVELAREAFAAAVREAGIEENAVERVVATGYGRGAIGFAHRAVTEITCHGRGVHHLRPGAATVVDIGGQDSKLLHLDGKGRVRDFVMNDRCAAGTGRFLEVVAGRLECDLARAGELAAAAAEPATISSMCVVFAETEIVGLLAAGAKAENILAGVQAAIASRIAAMAGGGAGEPILFTGGVALVPGMEGALARALGRPVATAPRPQFTGALGAALIAREG